MSAMKLCESSLVRPPALLAINLLFLTVWGFAGLDKVRSGMPTWFPEKFGATWLGTFPGVSATFWILAISEMLALTLAGSALFRLEFMGRRSPVCLVLALVWSLFVFLQLGFGLWLTRDFNGGFQQFMYFSATLIAIQFVSSTRAG